MLHRDDVFQFTAQSDLMEQAAKLRKMPNINGEDKIMRLFEKKKEIPLLLSLEYFRTSPQDKFEPADTDKL